MNASFIALGVRKDAFVALSALRPGPAGQLMGTCPFCRSTAFRVHPGHGTFYCFGCGEGGDARAFAAKTGHHR